MMSLIQNSPSIFMQSVEGALKQDLRVKLELTFNGPALTPLSLLERVIYFGNSTFHSERLITITNCVVYTLRHQERVSIVEASESKDLKTGRTLVKFLKSQNNAALSSCINSLMKEITAGKLGITKEQLDAHSFLQEFTEKNYLERYIVHYDHTLEIDNDTGDVLIRENDVFVSWNSVSSKLKSWEPRLLSPRQDWFYGKKGIQQQNMYDWEILTPYKIDDAATWNHEYVFEICACYNPESVMIGNHSWVRLKTPTGEIYSVGLYRPSKGMSSNLDTPLRAKPGYLTQPDVSEFWNFEIFTIAVKIDEQIFNKMKRAIEQDKRENNLIFHLNNDNCLLWCKKIGAIAKVSLSTEEPASSFIFPKRFISTINYIHGYLPTTIKKITDSTAAFFLNTLQLLLGANHLDANLNDQQRQKAKPLITGLSDMFNFERTIYNHPITFIQKTKAMIVQWRAEQINLLRSGLMCNDSERSALNERIKEIEFSLPPHCYA